MADAGEPLEPIAIDDRSPGERMAQRASAAFDRLRESADESPFDFAAFLWMVLVLTTVGIEAWSRLDLVSGSILSASGITSTGSSGWTKLSALASTSGYPLAAACIIGLAAAAIFRGRVAVPTAVLAALGSAWVAACGAMTFAVSLHHSGDVFSAVGTNNRAAGVASGLATLGTGLVVVWAASRLIPLLGRDFDDAMPDVS